MGQMLEYYTDGQPPLAQTLGLIQPGLMRNPGPYNAVSPMLSTVNPSTPSEVDAVAKVDGLRGLLNFKTSPVAWVVALVGLFLILNYHARTRGK